MSKYSLVLSLALVAGLSSCVTSDPATAPKEAAISDQGAAAYEPAQERAAAQERELSLAEREAELTFKREIQKIELEKKRMELERERQALKCDAPQPETARALCSRWQKLPCGQNPGHCAGFVAFCVLVHILLTIWVYGDLRQRKTASGLWIVLTLLTGLFGATLYALVRIGDKQATNP